MGKSSNFTKGVRNRILDLHSRGLDVGTIAVELNRKVSFVSSVIREAGARRGKPT